MKRNGTVHERIRALWTERQRAVEAGDGFGVALEAAQRDAAVVVALGNVAVGGDGAVETRHRLGVAALLQLERAQHLSGHEIAGLGCGDISIKTLRLGELAAAVESHGLLERGIHQLTYIKSPASSHPKPP